MRKSRTKEEYIELFNKIHNFEYDYSILPDKMALSVKIPIICKKHGIFHQFVNNHLHLKQKCPKCRLENQFLTQDQWIEKCKKHHGNKYDYSRAIYIRNNIPVTIICPHHGEFEQTPIQHSSGHGCYKCYHEFKRGKSRKVNKKDFIKRANKIHNKKYLYNKTIIGKRLVDKAIITCPKHGDFIQSLMCHLSGDGCPKCSGKHNMSTKEYKYLVNKKYNNYYNLSKVKFISNYKDIVIGCPVHGYQKVQARSFKLGYGCPFCNGSRLEKYIKSIFFKINLPFKTEFNIPGHSYRYDFHILDTNLLIEADGIQHFKPVEHFGGVKRFMEQKEIDNIKNDIAILNNFNLLRVRYDQTQEEIKNDIIKFISKHYPYYYKNKLFKSPLKICKYYNMDKDTNLSTFITYKTNIQLRALIDSDINKNSI